MNEASEIYHEQDNGKREIWYNFCLKKKKTVVWYYPALGD